MSEKWAAVKEELGDDNESLGEILIDGQSIELVSPQHWLQPIPCELSCYRPLAKRLLRLLRSL